MLNGRLFGSSDKIGSGTILWKARDMHAAGEIDDDRLVEMIAAGYVLKILLELQLPFLVFLASADPIE